jgi:hypothetical protein
MVQGIERRRPARLIAGRDKKQAADECQDKREEAKNATKSAKRDPNARRARAPGNFEGEREIVWVSVNGFSDPAHFSFA